jgi:hypothetical protein
VFHAVWWKMVSVSRSTKFLRPMKLPIRPMALSLSDSQIPRKNG